MRFLLMSPVEKIPRSPLLDDVSFLENQPINKVASPSG